jgi:hypothetical protein
MKGWDGMVWDEMRRGTDNRPIRKLLFPVCRTSFSLRDAQTQLSGPNSGLWISMEARGRG